MSEHGTFDGDELDFLADDNDLDDGLIPAGATCPLPSSLESVLMAWAIGLSPETNWDDPDIEEVFRKLLLVEDDRDSVATHLNDQAKLEAVAGLRPDCDNGLVKA